MAYAILTSHAFTGQKREKLRKAVAAAIRKGGGNPKRLAAIEILDANKIAEWVNRHPAIALWLATHIRVVIVDPWVQHYPERCGKRLRMIERKNRHQRATHWDESALMHSCLGGG